MSKIYRACGFRVGWVSFSGETLHAKDYLLGLDLLASLRLCSNVPGQWSVQTALGGYQSINKLIAPGGRLYQTRQVILEQVALSKYLRLISPKGAMYAFLEVDLAVLPQFDDEQFALDLLEEQHVLIAPGRSFNVPYQNHFRITLLPDERQMRHVFERINALLARYESLNAASS